MKRLKQVLQVMKGDWSELEAHDNEHTHTQTHESSKHTLSPSLAFLVSDVFITLNRVFPWQRKRGNVSSHGMHYLSITPSPPRTHTHPHPQHLRPRTENHSETH